jgi:hypothetical protein
MHSNTYRENFNSVKKYCEGSITFLIVCKVLQASLNIAILLFRDTREARENRNNTFAKCNYRVELLFLNFL